MSGLGGVGGDEQTGGHTAKQRTSLSSSSRPEKVEASASTPSSVVQCAFQVEPSFLQMNTKTMAGGVGRWLVGTAVGDGKG